MNNVQFILGLQIQTISEGIVIGQAAYFNKVLQRFGIADCNPVVTPLDDSQQLQVATPGTEIDHINEYQSIIGSLMYAVIGSRSDLAFTVAKLSQFSSRPNPTHLQAAKHVLRYLKGTTDWTLFYPRAKPDTLSINCYADSSYVNCLDTRRSYSGYVVTLGLSAFSWVFQRQKSVVVSITETEYIVLLLAIYQLT